MINLESEFKDFFGKIELNKTQEDRILSATTTLTDFLCEQYDLKKTKDAFTQGSFSTKTVTKPAPSIKDGEYDVDLVILCSNSKQTPSEALNSLEETIRNNGNYKNKIEKSDKNIPCVRLRYADENNAKFHIDIVPARKYNDSFIEIPRRNVGWELSNPQEYTEWVIKLGTHFQKIIMYLRRWRDEYEVPIKSVVLQVIVAKCLSKNNDDAESLIETFEEINEYLSSFDKPPIINNPVFNEENLTKNWTKQDFDIFKEEISDVIKIISKIKKGDDHDTVCKHWQSILGEDFIYQTNKEFLITEVEKSLGNFSHKRSLESYSIPYHPDPNVSMEIKAELKSSLVKYRFNGKRKIQLKTLTLSENLISGTPVESYKQIKFYVNVFGMRGDENYRIYWQVVNTGNEATIASGLRGEIFLSKDPYKKKWNSESTLYQGTHWIEAYVVKNNVCIARSGRFYVSIVHKNNI